MICLCIFSSTEAATLWIFIVQPRHVYNYSTIRRPLTRSVTFIAATVHSSNFTFQQAAVGWLWQINFGLTRNMSISLPYRHSCSTSALRFRPKGMRDDLPTK